MGLAEGVQVRCQGPTPADATIASGRLQTGTETEGADAGAIGRRARYCRHGRRERRAAAGLDGRAHERDAAGNGFTAGIDGFSGDVHVHRIETIVVEHGAVDPRLAGIAAFHRVRHAKPILRAGHGGERDEHKTHDQRDADGPRPRTAHVRRSDASASRYRSSVKPRTSRSPSTRTGTRKKPSSWTRYLISSSSVGGVRRTISVPNLARSRRDPRANASVPARSTGADSTRRLSNVNPSCERNSLAFVQVGQPFLL